MAPAAARKNLAPDAIKSEGTCKQGERADLTDCTPASGEAATPGGRYAEGKVTGDFYHGSGADFSEFDLGKLHTGADRGGSSWYGHGIYLSGEEWKGQMYAHGAGGSGLVYKVVAPVKNPLVVEGTGAAGLWNALKKIGVSPDLRGQEVTDTLLSLGYDSIAVLKDDSDKVNELIVFDPSIVKIVSKSPVKPPSVPPSPLKSLEQHTKSLTTHDHGCLMCALPDALRKEITDFVLENVPDFHLGPGGRETHPHITVKFGYNPSGPETLAALKAFLSTQAPFSVRLADALSLFTDGHGKWINEDGDVLKVAVESAPLRQLNATLSERFPCEDKFADNYQPHLTLAYLLPEVSAAHQPLLPPFLGRTVLIEALEWSGADGVREVIPLSVLAATESPFERLKRMGEYLVKGEGTCEAGQRADLTGCTPASGEGGGGKERPPGKPTAAQFQEWLDRGWSWGENGWEPPQEKGEASGSISEEEHQTAARAVSEPAKKLIAGSHDWEQSAPWNATAEQVQRGRFPGFKVGSYGDRGAETAHYEDGAVWLTPKFFQLKHEETRRAVVWHELGHELSDTMLNDGTAFRLKGAGVVPEELNGQTTPGEILAEAYSLLRTDPDYLRAHAPGLVEPLTARVRALGMPVGENANVTAPGKKTLSALNSNLGGALVGAKPMKKVRKPPKSLVFDPEGVKALRLRVRRKAASDWLERVDEILMHTVGKPSTAFDAALVEQLRARGESPKVAAFALVQHSRGKWGQKAMPKVPRATAAFTGRKRDSAGRNQCYSQGQHVACGTAPAKQPKGQQQGAVQTSGAGAPGSGGAAGGSAGTGTALPPKSFFVENRWERLEVVRNPSAGAVSRWIESEARKNPSFYLKGMIADDGQIYVWDGSTSMTHADLSTRLLGGGDPAWDDRFAIKANIRLDLVDGELVRKVEFHLAPYGLGESMNPGIRRWAEQSDVPVGKSMMEWYSKTLPTNPEVKGSCKPGQNPKRDGCTAANGTTTSPRVPDKQGASPEPERTPVPQTPQEAERKAVHKARLVLDKFRSAPRKLVQLGISKARALYRRMELKYGKRWARITLAVMIITMPTPFTGGAVAATIGLAHVCTKLFGSVPEEMVKCLLL